MKTIYCISGLGADQRIFKKLSISDVKLVGVDWLRPDWHDEIPCYAQKMSAQIPGEAPIIIGVSFGGMLASEIIRMRPDAKVIIISSAKDVTELPRVGRFLRIVAKSHLAPVGVMKIPSKQVDERFGAETEEEKTLLHSILKDTDNHFSRWAFKAMVNWKTAVHDPRIIHIHGTADRMIPSENIQPTHWIEGGHHLMVYSRADEVSRLIAQHL